MLPEVAVTAPDVAVKVYVPTLPVSLHPAKVDTPLVVLTGFVVQANVGVPDVKERVIAVPLPNKLLFASFAVTAGCCANALPLVAVPDGAVVNVNVLKAPGLTVNPVKQALDKVPSVALIATTFVFRIFTPLKLTTPEEFDGVPEFVPLVTNVVQVPSEYPLKVIVDA